MLFDLPNILTISRLAAVPFIVGLASTGSPTLNLIAGIIFCVAAATDYFDGKIARARGSVTSLGRILDPIADKVLVGAVSMVLIARQSLPLYGVYSCMLLVLRDIFVGSLRTYSAEQNINVPVSKLAKWKTMLQMVALATLISADVTTDAPGTSLLSVSYIGSILLWISVLLALLTTWAYFRIVANSSIC